jgi:hypothetical protein
MIDKAIGKFKFLFDIDFKNWGLGIWLHLDGQDAYGWAFEIIVGCAWFEILYNDKV